MHRAICGLGIAAAVPAGLAVLVVLFGTLCDIALRFLLAQPSGEIEETVGAIARVLLVASLIPGIPYLLAAGFLRDPSSGVHVQRTALAVFPGIVVALILSAAILAAVVAMQLPALRAVVFNAWELLRQSTFLGLLPCIALAGLATGADPARRVSTAAAPLVIAWIVALTMGQSIGQILAGLVLPCAILAIPFLVGLAFAARAALPWLIGLGLLFFLFLFTAAGLLTPSEAAAVVAFIGLVIAVPLRLALAGRTFVPLLRVAGGEIVAVIACVATATMGVVVSVMLGVSEAMRGVFQGLPPIAALGASALIVLVLSTFLTPLAALPAAIMLGVGLQNAKAEMAVASVAICMACLAGVLIRSTAWQDDGTGRKAGLESGKLPRVLGWSAILVLLALIVVAVFVPDVVTALPRALY